MNPKDEIVYKRKYLPIFTASLIMLMTVSISYAFYSYTSYGTKDTALDYGKVFMDFDELSEGAVLTNLYPMTDEEGINSGTSFNFAVKGYNPGSQPLYYNIFAIQGSHIVGKTRFNDSEINIYLTDDQESVLYGPAPAIGLSENGANLIERSISGGDENNLIVHNYILKAWVNDSVVISNTETSIPNKTIYTTNQIKNKYFSIKIKVKAHPNDGTTYQVFKDVLLAPSNIKGEIIHTSPGSEPGLYYLKDEDRYIFRGGITKINSSELSVGNYENDIDSGNEPNNYVKVPWETYGENETCANKENNKCWRIVSITSDRSIIIVRDRNESNQVFDNTHNTAASIAKNEPTEDFGYNDLLENVPTSGHPEEYRPYSLMYTKLYGINGYQNTTLSNYFSLLNLINVCLNKVNNYIGLNYATYKTTLQVKNTCDVIGREDSIEVNPLNNVYVRLPYAEEFLGASLESTCTGDYQHQCRNKNYMYNKTGFALVNGHATSTWYVRCVIKSGYVERNSANESFGVRPVVSLKSTVLINGGTGTELDPYII